MFRSLFIEMGKSEKTEADSCCPLKMKTGKKKKSVIMNEKEMVHYLIKYA